MGKRKTTEQFISEAIKVHGDKYDYSKVEYVNNHTLVTVICPMHGEFKQAPLDHLHNHGCPKCPRKSKMGVCDIHKVANTTCHNVWKGIIGRCYLTNRSRDYSYKDCKICDEWLTFSNFKKWFDDNHQQGYDIDKDLLIKGNKVYSPDTCCFIPPELNKVFTKRKRCRGKFPLGVAISKSGKYDSRIRMNKKDYFLGAYTTIEEAFNAYKTAKEKYIKELAEKYFQEGKITEKVYNALMKYEVEITD